MRSLPLIRVWTSTQFDRTLSGAQRRLEPGLHRYTVIGPSSLRPRQPRHFAGCIMAAGHLARRLRRPRVISRQPKLFRRITAVPRWIGC